MLDIASLLDLREGLLSVATTWSILGSSSDSSGSPLVEELLACIARSSLLLRLMVAWCHSLGLEVVLEKWKLKSGSLEA
jgi:hypothetical protein